MLRHRLSISAAVDLPIHHCLMALPGVHLNRLNAFIPIRRGSLNAPNI